MLNNHRAKNLVLFLCSGFTTSIATAQTEKAMSCFFSQDFSGGTVPTGWDIGAQVETQDQNGIGQGTFVDAWRVGNSVDANTGGYFPVPDVPADNAFLMANDDATPCNCDLSSVDVQLPVLDLSARTGVAMECRVFYDALFGSGGGTIEASDNGGGNWNTLLTLQPEPGSWQDLFVDLSAFDGDAAVLVRFTWSDSSNWSSGFALDDVCVRERNTNDITLEQVFLAEVQPLAFSDTIRSLEYTLIPLEQTTELVVGIEVINRGTAVANNVQMQVVVSLNSLLQTTASGNIIPTLQPGETVRSFVNTGWIPTIAGEVSLECSVTAANDDDATDNMRTRSYRVTAPGNFAENSAIGIDLITQDATVDANGDDFAVGVRLETIAAGSIHGASVLLDNTSELGSVVRAQLLDENLGILATTADHVVNTGDLSGWPLYLAFDTPQPLSSGTDHHIVIANDADSGSVTVACSGVAPTGSALFYDVPSASWEYITKIPMVRAHFNAPVVGVEEVPTDNLKARLWPVPAMDHLSVQLNATLGANARYEILATNGQILLAGSITNSASVPTVFNISVSALPAGLYAIRLIGSDLLTTGQFVVLRE